MLLKRNCGSKLLKVIFVTLTCTTIDESCDMQHVSLQLRTDEESRVSGKNLSLLEILQVHLQLILHVRCDEKYVVKTFYSKTFYLVLQNKRQ